MGDVARGAYQKAVQAACAVCLSIAYQVDSPLQTCMSYAAEHRLLLPQRQQNHLNQVRMPRQQGKMASGLYRRVMKQSYVRSKCIPSNSRGYSQLFATISRSSVQAHKAFSATTKNHSSSSDGIPPFLGLLCTIPFPLYPSDDMPVMGSVFWFYMSNGISIAPLHIPQSFRNTLHGETKKDASGTQKEGKKAR